ncbi:MAG: hypothetical protein V1799_17835 [bacterium]
MSLGIVFKGPEGIVLAADSRVTLMAQIPGGPVLPATFDNTTKLLRVNGQDYVGIVTYGLGAIGQQNPRTAHSYIPEFEASIEKKRLKVGEVAEKLGDFFMQMWIGQKMPNPEQWAGQPDMVFMLGGYDEGEAYGRVYEIDIPSRPVPKEWHTSDFGPVWGGQQEFVGRLIHGYDPQLVPFVQKTLGLTAEQTTLLSKALSQLQVQIPYQFLPLQDCINLSALLVRTTMEMQSFYVGLRGVGGNIDIAAITKTGGFQPIKEKDVAKLFNPRNTR